MATSPTCLACVKMKGGRSQLCTSILSRARDWKAGPFWRQMLFPSCVSMQERGLHQMWLSVSCRGERPLTRGLKHRGVAEPVDRLIQGRSSFKDFVLNLTRWANAGIYSGFDSCIGGKQKEIGSGYWGRVQSPASLKTNPQPPLTSFLWLRLNRSSLGGHRRVPLGLGGGGRVAGSVPSRKGGCP